MELVELLRERRSIHRFENREVDPDLVAVGRCLRAFVVHGSDQKSERGRFYQYGL